MPKVTVTVPHHQTPQEIIAKTRPVVEKTVQDFQGQDLQMDWHETSADFCFSTLGFRIAGQVLAEENQVVVEIDLPLVAMAFKDRVQEAVSEHMTRAITAASSSTG